MPAVLKNSEDLNSLIAAIVQIRDMHPRECRMQAMMNPPVVEYLEFDSNDMVLSFVVSETLDDDERYVDFFLPNPQNKGRMVSIGCDCPVCAARRPCVHTYAVVCDLVKRLPRANDELRALLMQGVSKAPKSPLLSSLDKLIELESHQTVNESVVARSGHRLIWRVRVLMGYSRPSIDITTVDQSLKKDNVTWKKGTRITFENLQYSDLVEGPHDIAARDYIHNSRFQHRPGFGFGPAPIEILDRLAGSTRVFLEVDGCDLPVAVRKGDLSLNCEVIDNKLRVTPLCDGHLIDNKYGCFDTEGHRIFAAGESVLSVVDTQSQGFCEFALMLMNRSSDVPMAEAPELLARLTQLSTRMPVHMPEALMGDDLIANRMLYLELIPNQPQGMIVRLRACPLAGGATVLPGDRRAPTHALQDGQVRRIARDFDTELARANTIVSELNLKSYNALTEWDYRLQNDDQVIDFVIRLSERQNRRRAEEIVTVASVVSESTPEIEPANEAASTTALAPSNNLAVKFGAIPSTDDLTVLWPQGGEVRVTSEIESDALRLAVEEHDDWFGLTGEIVVDGHSIPLMKVLQALKAGRRVVSLGEGLFARISDEFYDRLLAIGDVVHQTSKGMEVDITAAPVLSDLVDMRESLQLCQSWKNILRNLDETSVISLEPPSTLTAELREYQAEGYRWMKRLSMWGVGGCLADDMGLGKTVQALALVLDRIQEGPTLVVAPMSVGFNWMREAQRFASSLNVVAYRDSNRDEVLKEVGVGDVVIVSYAMLQRDAEKFWAVEWGTLILDEAQNVKNATTKTARAVRDLNAKWRLALTGTPIENQLSELWALFRAVSPGLFGSWDRFRERFVTPIEKSNDTGRRKSLARMVKPFILRRTKDEVLKELPERTEIQTTIELSDEERKLYEAARVRIVAELMGLDFGGSKDHRFQVLAGITKLRQLACHPFLVDKKWKKSSAKLDSLMELVEELRGENHRALIFSQFTQHLDLVCRALDEIGVIYQYLDGSSTAKQRIAAVDAFQAGEGDVFLISLKAGGTGLNLTGADYVIHLDPWWNPAVEDQATDRAHRMGQTRPVTVYRLVAKDTIEEKIIALHERKRQLVSSVLEGSDEAAKLSTDELINLIKTSGQGSTDPELTS